MKAYDLGLVKQIEVDSVVSEDSFNQAFVRLEGIKTQKTKISAKLTFDYEADSKFIELWERIRQKTTYRVEYQTDELIRRAARRLAKMPEILAARIVAQRTRVLMDSGGIS